jgi:hypothetical protein
MVASDVSSSFIRVRMKEVNVEILLVIVEDII